MVLRVFCLKIGGLELPGAMRDHAYGKQIALLANLFAWMPHGRAWETFSLSAHCRPRTLCRTWCLFSCLDFGTVVGLRSSAKAQKDFYHGAWHYVTVWVHCLTLSDCNKHVASAPAPAVFCIDLVCLVQYFLHIFGMLEEKYVLNVC